MDVNALQGHFPFSTWLAFCPPEVLLDDVLTAIAAWAAEPRQRPRAAEHARTGAYPRPFLAELQQLGLSRLLGPEATAWHASALNVLLGGVDGSLAITVGVNSLALLPIHLDGSEALRARVFRAVAQNGFASLALTERAHGSNLARTETWAEPQPAGGWRLHGEKHLINGATEHAIVTVLARTGAKDGAAMAGYTLFNLERRAGMRSLPRWSTLPASGADISGIAFDGTAVDADDVVGEVGEGFAAIRRTLTLSRGGVSALAAGAASAALALADRHARTRDVYGQPILALDAIASQLARTAALEAAAAAVSLRACAWANAFGQAASLQTAVAKLAAARLAEEAVDEGRRILGAQALLDDQPYAQLVRDVLLYGVFDGTSHLMLQEIAFGLDNVWGGRRLDADPIGRATRAWAEAPRAVRQLGTPAPAIRTDYERLADTYAQRGTWAITQCLPGVVRALRSVHLKLRDSGAWSRQSTSFELAEILAWLEVSIACVELGDPGVRSLLALAPAPARTDALHAGAALLAHRAAVGLERFMHWTGANTELSALPLPALARASQAAHFELIERVVRSA